MDHPKRTLKSPPASSLQSRKLPAPSPEMADLLKRYDSMTKIHDRLSCWVNVLDEKGNVISWNKAAEQISGYQRQEVLGHGKIWEWLYPDPQYHKEVFSKAMEIIRGKSVQNLETTIVTKDGRKRIISWQSNNLVDDKGRVKGSVALGADVTDQKAMDEQTRLQEKMEGMARLSGNIAHTFNNTFSIIQGYVELVLERMDYNAPGREDLLEIVEAVERGSALTNQLLAFSKHQILEPISIDLNQIISAMGQVLHRALGDKIQLIQNLDPRLPTIQADPNQIQQVILNLALNAREEMPEGGKFSLSTALSQIEYAHIRAHPFVSPGEYILLTASDSGQGISPRLKEIIFEPFLTTRADRAGLLLSTVYGIVNQHNGYIWVESESGKGTAYLVYLPVSGKPAQMPAPKKDGPELPKGSEAILLVEDDDYMRTLAVRVLRNLGYTVIESGNPIEALQILKQYPKPVNLLLSDVEMPQMNGAQLAEQSLKIRPNLKVLYFSGYSLAYLVDKKILKPDSPLLAKPFSLRSLSQKVREILNKKK